MATFPTGHFSIYAGEVVADHRLCFQYEASGQQVDKIYHTSYLVNEDNSRADAARFEIVDGQNHTDGSWSGKLRVIRPGQYEGCFLHPSANYYPYAANSSSERWRFYDDGKFYKLINVNSGYPFTVTTEKCGESLYTRCVGGATPAEISVRRF